MSELLDVFSKQRSNPENVPFWFMRQAGRFLPEYRQVREKMGGFLDLCYNSEQASEVTLQPLRRFDMSAAIIFSDILVVPHAIGYDVSFVKGEGPKLTPLETVDEVKSFDQDRYVKFLQPVYDALALTRKTLPEQKTLIGFCGAPWTVACYTLQGKGGKEFAVAREKIYSQPELVKSIIEQLQEAIAVHLIEQIKAGANVVQIFDSWAAYAPIRHRKMLNLDPVAYIVKRVKAEYPDVPIIGFPKGLGHVAAEYVEATGVDGFGVDMFSSIKDVRDALPDDVVVQGNLDPLLVAGAKDEMLQVAKENLEAMRGKRFIFNLGHGMVPHTPIDNVETLSTLIREFK